MRTFLICTVLLLAAFVGYAYSVNPTGCQTLMHDMKDLVVSLAPGPVTAPAAVSPPGPNLQERFAAPATAAIARRVGQVAELETPPVPPVPVPAAVPVPAPAPRKHWAPPAVIPAQPNWNWTTSNGKTYQNVVISEIKPDTVSITHSMGSGTIPILLLPPEIQQQLNYDPEAAAAARDEVARESAHPYYRVTALAEAQAAARQLGWPLAWVEAPLDLVNQVNPPANSDAELCQMALAYLKTRAVIVLANGNEDLGALSPVIRDQQLFQMDDGPLPGGHHFYAPKIVFSDAGVTHAFGRVSHTQMLASREQAIEATLQVIANDAAAQALLNGAPAAK